MILTTEGLGHPLSLYRVQYARDKCLSLSLYPNIAFHMRTLCESTCLRNILLMSAFFSLSSAGASCKNVLTDSWTKTRRAGGTRQCVEAGDFFFLPPRAAFRTIFRRESRETSGVEMRNCDARIEDCLSAIASDGAASEGTAEPGRARFGGTPLAKWWFHLRGDDVFPSLKSPLRSEMSVTRGLYFL